MTLSDIPAWAPIALSALSAGTLVAGVAFVPRLVARLPVDFVVDPRPLAAARSRWRTAARNLGGGILIVAGVAMLVLPGQGLVTILAGLLLLEFPGRHRWLAAILRREGPRRTVNRLRARRGAAPLCPPQ